MIHDPATDNHGAALLHRGDELVQCAGKTLVAEAVSVSVPLYPRGSQALHVSGGRRLRAHQAAGAEHLDRSSAP